MPILVVTKLLFVDYVVYAVSSYNKGSSKNIIFWEFCRHNIWAHTYIAHNSVIFGPIPNSFIGMLRKLLTNR